MIKKMKKIKKILKSDLPGVKQEFWLGGPVTLWARSKGSSWSWIGGLSRWRSGAGRDGGF